MKTRRLPEIVRFSIPAKSAPGEGANVNWSRKVACVAVVALLAGAVACSSGGSGAEATPDGQESTSQDESQDDAPASGADADVSAFAGSWNLESETAPIELDVDDQGNVSGGDEVSWKGTIEAGQESGYLMTLRATQKGLQKRLQLTATADADVWDYVDEVNGAKDVLRRQD